MYYDLWPYVQRPLDFEIQKRIVSAETIRENTAFRNNSALEYYSEGSYTVLPHILSRETTLF